MNSPDKNPERIILDRILELVSKKLLNCDSELHVITPAGARTILQTKEAVATLDLVGSQFCVSIDVVSDAGELKEELIDMAKPNSVEQAVETTIRVLNGSFDT